MADYTANFALSLKFICKLSNRNFTKDIYFNFCSNSRVNETKYCTHDRFLTLTQEV